MSKAQKYYKNIGNAIQIHKLLNKHMVPINKESKYGAEQSREGIQVFTKSSDYTKRIEVLQK